jgi:hypothetical protein
MQCEPGDEHGHGHPGERTRFAQVCLVHHHLS